MSMEFGLALDFGTADERLAAHFDEQLELVRLGESLGFSSVWAGQSFEPRAFHSASPFLFLASLARQTRMRIGTGVLLLPGWDPLTLAYEGAVLDQLSEGRLTLGVGLGSPALARRFGRDPAHIGKWMEDVLMLLQALWRGQRGYQGPMVQVEGGVWPPPIQQGGPPLWIGGALRRSAERAARLGQGYYASTTHSLTHIRGQAAAYRAALHQQDRPPNGAVSANRLTLVAPSEEEAHRLGRAYFGPVLYRYASIGSLGAHLQSDPGSPDDVYDRLQDELCLVGTPEQVARRLSAYREAGVTHVQTRVRPSQLPAAAARQTLSLLATGVMTQQDAH